jgi:hypothetical protein
LKPEKGESDTSADPKKAAVKPQKTAGTDAKTIHTKPAVKPNKTANTSTKPVKAPVIVENPRLTTPLEDISDLLNSLSHEVCVQLTRRVVASISSLPTGAARHTAVLKPVILFYAEYGSTP